MCLEGRWGQKEDVSLPPKEGDLTCMSDVHDILVTMKT